MNASHELSSNDLGQQAFETLPPRPLLWMINSALLFVLIAVHCLISLPASADNQQYMIDDDHINAPYKSSMLPNSVTTLYQTTLPNFFGLEENTAPKISISIQQLDDSESSALMDEEKQKSLRSFTGDPLDRKALVIEVPFN